MFSLSYFQADRFRLCVTTSQSPSSVSAQVDTWCHDTSRERPEKDTRDFILCQQRWGGKRGEKKKNGMTFSPFRRPRFATCRILTITKCKAADLFSYTGHVTLIPLASVCRAGSGGEGSIRAGIEGPRKWPSVRQSRISLNLTVAGRESGWKLAAGEKTKAAKKHRPPSAAPGPNPTRACWRLPRHIG